MELKPIDETYRGHQVYVGERGGKFYIDDNGKKRYIKPYMVKPALNQKNIKNSRLEKEELSTVR